MDARAYDTATGQQPNLQRSLSERVSTSLVKTQRDTRAFFRKPRNVVATGLFFALVSRIVYNHLHERVLVHDLLSSFDVSHDLLLSSAELKKLLSTNGLDITTEQVEKIFGRVDDEADGYDQSELVQIVKALSGLPVVSDRIKSISSYRSLFADVLFLVVAGAGLAYLLSHSDNMERKWAANSFHSAVLYRRMQSRCSKLEGSLEKLSSERARLETEIKQLEGNKENSAANRSQLGALQGRLEAVRREQEEAKTQLQMEAKRWRQEADKNLREVTMTTQKLNRMMTCLQGLGTCVKGLEAFSGAGTGDFAALGAQKGFSVQQHGVGFSLNSITFGTVETDDRGKSELKLYETSSSNKLGEGRDCAYRCTEVTSGTELALKMYKIDDKEQRRSIHHDLYAHMSQVGRHPRIVSYKSVIESESTIFVLMELVKGKDLFDVVCSHKLSEEVARPLFQELVEGLQHLHDNGVIHCDIKPENVMVTGDVMKRSAHVKLIDFGCSCFKKFDRDQEGCVVWDTYMPPELSADRERAPDVTTDMWRLGCTLFVMLARRPPFHDDAETRGGREARVNGMYCRDPPFDSLSSEAKDLIALLINGDPQKRPTCAEVLRHPWIARQDGEAGLTCCGHKLR